MAKKTRNIVLGLVLTGVVIFVALTVLTGRSPQPTPLPNPNGYDDFLRAGKMMAGKFDDVANLDREALRALVETNTEPLRVLRLGLTHRSAVPTDVAIANFATISGDLMKLKLLAKLLSAEGRLRELENRPADAAHSYLDDIRLGSEMSHGGFMINRLVGIACEEIGRSRLVKLVPKLSSEQLRPLVLELEQIESNGVKWEEVLRNERRVDRSLRAHYSNPIALVSDLWQARTIRRASKDRHDVAAARLRLLTSELALRRYRSEEGLAPGRLDQLVPKYLQLVPSDPFSGHPLAYRPQGTNWLLYSVGPDRVDDGGKPVGRNVLGDDLIVFGGSMSGGGPAKKGDLFYDSPW